MTSDAAVLRFSLSEVEGAGQSQMALSTTINKKDLFEDSFPMASVIIVPPPVDKNSNSSPQPSPQLPPQPLEYITLRRIA